MSEFRLEVGKKYVDRRGRVYGPMIDNNGRFDEVYDSYGWGCDGRRSCAGESQVDLIAEYAESAPIESPDDWVTQYEVPPRAGIDEIHWTGWGIEHWIPAHGIWAYHMLHGIKRAEGTLCVRCRRKDLPPPLPKQISVRLWVSERITNEPGDWPVRCGVKPPSGLGSWSEIFPSPDGFFVKKQP